VLAVVHAVAADVAALAILTEELDRFYGATEFDPPEQREDQIRATLFGSRPVAYALLAKDGPDLVGFASYSFLWPAAGVTSSLFLKELYVRQDRQRQGVGRALMQALAGVAVDNGCGRLEWQTDDDNEQAKRFYKLLGAPVFASKVFYRVDGEELRRLAAD
jgi:GNAT superfamily N-acetyltransferase